MWRRGLTIWIPVKDVLVRRNTVMALNGGNGEYSAPRNSHLILNWLWGADGVLGIT